MGVRRADVERDREADGDLRPMGPGEGNKDEDEGWPRPTDDLFEAIGKVIVAIEGIKKRSKAGLGFVLKQPETRR